MASFQSRQTNNSAPFTRNFHPITQPRFIAFFHHGRIEGKKRSRQIEKKSGGGGGEREQGQRGRESSGRGWKTGAVTAQPAPRSFCFNCYDSETVRDRPGERATRPRTGAKAEYDAPRRPE